MGLALRKNWYGAGVVTGMALGIVIDDTVHFLTKYLHARRNRGLNTESAVEYAISSVGRALFTTTIVHAFKSEPKLGRAIKLKIPTEPAITDDR